MEKVVEAVNAGLEKGVRAVGSVIDDIQYGQPQEAQLGPQLVDRLGLLLPMLETEKLFISSANQLLGDTRLCLLKNVKKLSLI